MCLFRGDGAIERWILKVEGRNDDFFIFSRYSQTYLLSTVNISSLIKGVTISCILHDSVILFLPFLSNEYY